MTIYRINNRWISLYIKRLCYFQVRKSERLLFICMMPVLVATSKPGWFWIMKRTKLSVSFSFSLRSRKIIHKSSSEKFNKICKCKSNNWRLTMRILKSQVWLKTWLRTKECLWGTMSKCIFWMKDLSLKAISKVMHLQILRPILRLRTHK